LIQLPALKEFIQNRRENVGAINEDLERKAEEELERHKEKIQSRLNPKPE